MSPRRLDPPPSSTYVTFPDAAYTRGWNDCLLSVRKALNLRVFGTGHGEDICRAPAKWESDFLFYVWDQTVTKQLASPPSSIRELAALLKKETDEAVDLWGSRCRSGSPV